MAILGFFYEPEKFHLTDFCRSDFKNQFSRTMLKVYLALSNKKLQKSILIAVEICI